MPSVLFICTHNSARSQIAEGLTNHFFKNWTAYSAGTEKTKVKPEAIESLKKIGVDISHHRSKTLDEFEDKNFDLVVTVCDSAKENCPYFPGAKKIIHAGFEDPSNVDPVYRQEAFDKTRDLIKLWLDNNLSIFEV